ncbi:GH1 family beta-glucosidase [Actinokineospora sp. NBRC 105648]|uniref:GH1 family beta-glucosidase n=1 Tax=Actinokineospora sp. NBRC 105648 TaxID=3032206 RepID=UPI0024A2A533|nr:GH1 family beta-glucosidase [Actinokineospora sp. NBRC 105648]GLZ40236.1 beta-glucosidase [Actinokineospora sp. NBRC 105648]
MPFPEFPPDFRWGVASAAYQVEGAVAEDGRAPSVWDTFCAEPGRVRGGDTGAVATDHYHRYREDVGLLRDLGVGAYRFSISWPRVMPDGVVNAKGLDFYDRLVDELCAAGIAPAATLFHWDTPQALEDAGGWLTRDITGHFADYAAVVGERLGDRVRLWMPLNEPMVVTMFGYALGNHAPGKTLGFEALPAVHHQLLGHGLAVQALRAAGCTGIGIASNHAPVWPASESEVDTEAARSYDTLVNWLFADPILRGRYPVEELAVAMPGPVVADLAVISTPLDFYGINYYQPALVGASTSDDAEVAGALLPPGLPFAPRPITGYPTTDFGWAVVPDGLRQTVQMFRDRYGDALPPLYITESGCSYHDPDPVDGRVPDADRIAYHDGHLRALAQAMAEGADVRGYFAWSATDNFEWAEGYRERFGLVHVDYASQVRTPKDSYHWYRDVIAGRAV